jgi:hypothetical protein
MLTALVLASLAQFPLIVEQQEPVVYEMQITTSQQYFSVPEVRTVVPTVTYSLPAAYFVGADPLVGVYPPFMGGRAVVKGRWPGFPGFRSRVRIRY